MQITNARDTGLPPTARAQLAAMPGFLLLFADHYAAVYNTSGAIFRFGPKGVVAASMQDIAMAGGLMVSHHSLPFVNL